MIADVQIKCEIARLERRPEAGMTPTESLLLLALYELRGHRENCNTELEQLSLSDGDNS